MSGLAANFIRVVLIPAAVFQAVIFGGAYGTGREIAEFISSHGSLGGLLSLAVVGLGFGVILSLSFELARIERAYDYRGFLHTLIGRAWIAFEILFIISLVIVLAVNGSAAGSILRDQFGIPSIVGVSLLFTGVVVLNYLGKRLLQESMAICMIALVIVLLVFCGLTLVQYQNSIRATFSAGTVTGDWLTHGAQFMFYSAAVIPVLLYSARNINTRGEAIVSGFSAGIMGAFPALVFHIVFMADLASLDQELPTYWMIGQLAQPWLMVAYIIVLFAMIIQTVAGLLQGVNERLDAWQIERTGIPCAPGTHAIVAGATLAISLVLTSFGITALVAQGYGTIAWGYLVIYIIPLLTIGVYKVWRKGNSVTSE
jgi:uncharacterized membrane protein YkvI